MTLPRALCLLLVLLAAAPARAVRPFVTDDARIIDVGQIEVETWPELVRRGGRTNTGWHAMAGSTVNEWLEIIVGGGIGLNEDGSLAFANPVIQPKLLIWRAEEDGLPGLSLAAGVTLPFGQGYLHDDAIGLLPPRADHFPALRRLAAAPPEPRVRLRQGTGRGRLHAAVLGFRLLDGGGPPGRAAHR